MPVQEIRLMNCDDYQLDSPFTGGTPLCQLNVESGAFAWYDESTQQIDKSVYPWESAVHKKKIRADCMAASSIVVNLNNGRSCQSHANCKSRLCQGGICQGLLEKEQCHDHSDCHSGLYCLRDKDWPYLSKCAAVNTNYANCEEDYQCLTSAYCWYANVDDRKIGQRKCLPLYSQLVGTNFGWYSKNPMTNLTYDDYEINGRYCQSGLAFPVSDKSDPTQTISTNCTDTDRIFYEGKNLSDPFKCDPTDQSKQCHIFYNASYPNNVFVLPQKSFPVRCNCALDGNHGYCSKILGT
jgi:hypothetical protein